MAVIGERIKRNITDDAKFDGGIYGGNGAASRLSQSGPVILQHPFAPIDGGEMAIAGIPRVRKSSLFDKMVIDQRLTPGMEATASGYPYPQSRIEARLDRQC